MSNKNNKINYGLIELKQNFPFDIFVEDIFSHRGSSLIYELYSHNLMCFDIDDLEIDYPGIPTIAKKKRVAIDFVAISSKNPFNMDSGWKHAFGTKGDGGVKMYIKY
ncbi:hypothetical protein MTR_4g094798 [Medicago truncatula]|uniref:Uncharacterized protein n=1 Tax=Medicago truncatula TaxID=3880 RepID=A0A072V023_MEDTR|nr:hypothetical protein MTR_4g094798 [Medicago truncatula]